MVFTLPVTRRSNEGGEGCGVVFFSFVSIEYRVKSNAIIAKVHYTFPISFSSPSVARNIVFPYGADRRFPGRMTVATNVRDSRKKPP